MTTHVLDVVAPLTEPSHESRDPRARRRLTLLGEIDRVANELDRSPSDWFDDNYSGAFVVESLPAAWRCFLRYPDEIEAPIRVATEHARDADTVGALVGALVGAHLGAHALPREWIDWIPERDGQDIEAAADALAALAF